VQFTSCCSPVPAGAPPLDPGVSPDSISFAPLPQPLLSAVSGDATTDVDYGILIHRLLKFRHLGIGYMALFIRRLDSSVLLAVSAFVDHTAARSMIGYWHAYRPTVVCLSEQVNRNGPLRNTIFFQLSTPYMYRPYPPKLPTLKISKLCLLIVPCFFYHVTVFALM